MAGGGGDGWQSKQETAWAVMALTNYMQLSGELAANYSFAVTLNDKSLLTAQTGSQGTGQQPLTMQLPIKALLAGHADILQIHRPHAGRTLCYPTVLNGHLPLDP